MRRSHRTGAAVAAAATLLTGAGFAVASLESTAAPAKVDVVSDTQPVTTGEDLDATLRDLRDQADDLTIEIGTREEAAKAARLAGERDRAEREADQSTPAARALPTAPETDATTGASGSGTDEDEDESDEGDRGGQRENDDD